MLGFQPKIGLTFEQNADWKKRVAAHNDASDEKSGWHTTFNGTLLRAPFELQQIAAVAYDLQH